METFGKRLKKLRNSKGLTQEELSKLIGVSSSTIGMYERDARQPDNVTLFRFTDFFEVSTDYILGYDSKKNRSTEAYDFEVNTKKLDDNVNLVFNDQAGLSDDEIAEIQSIYNFIKSKNKKG